MYMDIKRTLHVAVQGALAGIGATEAVFFVGYPPVGIAGDYSVSASAAYSAGKILGKSPQETAELICTELDRAVIPQVERVEVAGGCFINIFLSPEYFAGVVSRARVDGEKWGSNAILEGKRVLLEKSAPNLFKPFHVGHLLNISVGESLSRLMRFSGAEVIDIAYPSDISLGVAKAVWAIIESGLENELSVGVLGECYVLGTRKYDEDESAKKTIIEINKKLNARTAGKEWDIYQRGVALNLEYFKNITERLGSDFAGYVFESESGVVGKEIVEQHVPNIFTVSDGAIIFEGEKYGLHTRVFVTSLGLPVYEAKDLGLLKLKFDKYNPDISVVITDVEQKQYFEVIKKAAGLVDEKWSEKSVYWQHGRMRFEGGSISSRYGNVPLAEDLIEKVKDAVEQKINTVLRATHANAHDDAQLEAIAISALRYAFLRSGSGHNIVFDFDKSLSFDGDSGPYLEYAHARCCSILRKGKEAGILSAPSPNMGEGWGDVHAVSNASSLLRILSRFPSAVERAVCEYEPHFVTQYLTELAGAFNAWYANTRVLDGTDEAPYKLAVVDAVRQTLLNGLWLLGCRAQEEM